MYQPKTAEEQTNATVSHEVYALAEAVAKDDVVVVELSLNGTPKGNLAISEGVIPPTTMRSTPHAATSFI